MSHINEKEALRGASPQQESLIEWSTPRKDSTLKLSENSPIPHTVSLSILRRAENKLVMSGEQVGPRKRKYPGNRQRSENDRKEKDKKQKPKTRMDKRFRRTLHLETSKRLSGYSTPQSSTGSSLSVPSSIYVEVSRALVWVRTKNKKQTNKQTNKQTQTDRQTNKPNNKLAALVESFVITDVNYVDYLYSIVQRLKTPKHERNK